MGSLLVAAVQFIPLDSVAPKLFGFPELLTGLALVVLAWTTTDIRYRFRVRTAPLPLQGVTFGFVAAIAALTLLTDLWTAQAWPVPEGNLLSPAEWQGILGGAFLLSFLSWAWFAFIRPPAYGRRNAARYARTLFRIILKGSPSELAVISDEFGLSAKSLIRFATEQEQFRDAGPPDNGRDKPRRRPPRVVGYANDILLLIADKRFCRAVVESSPGTALAIFREISQTQKYGVRVKQFAKNIMNEALANKDSFLFHEVEGYESGLIGYLKPLSQAMFSNYTMVEAIGTLLDPDMREEWKWDSVRWSAYCRVVLMAFRDYVENYFWSHSFVLYRAKGYIERAVFDLYKINGLTNIAWDDDIWAIVRVVVKFIEGAIEILEKKGVPKGLKLRVCTGQTRDENFYDHLAKMIFEVVFSASSVRSPADLCWSIQHNSVWGEFFNFDKLNGAAGKVIKFKVRRLIYDEVAGLRRFSGFKGARLLGFCLNVMGLEVSKADYDQDSRPLHKAILSWTKKNYAWLCSDNQQVAEAALVDDIAYDSRSLRIVKTYPANGLRSQADYVFLQVEPAPKSGGNK